MWCKSCGQDVPGIASLEDDAKIGCARCGGILNSQDVQSDEEVVFEPLDERASEGAVGIDRAAPPGSAQISKPPPLNQDDWDWDEDLRSVESLVSSLNLSGHEPSKPSPAASMAPTNLSPLLVSSPKRRRRKMGFISWTILSLGLMTFICGGVLLGWAFFSQRGDLWSLGLPITLLGQSALLIALVMQLDGLWQSNRETYSALEEIDREISELRHTAALLSTTQSPSAKSFYEHMSHGASPHLLLADLKGQLDTLALSMAKEKR